MSNPMENALPAVSTQLVSFNQLFSEHFFVIPDYQRGYSWEGEQIRDLMRDIENLFYRSHKHYTGTIVASLSGEKEDVFEIVDGQQRITSLVILLKCIYDLDKRKYKSIYNKYIERGDMRNSRLVLTPNLETKEFFKKCIVENKNPERREIKSHENIVRAKTLFNEWLEQQNSSKIDQILHAIEHNLGFIFFIPKNNKSIGIMFEVINNRGKRLSELEKIKNYLIFYSTVQGISDLREVVNTEWVKIQKNW